MKKLDRKVPAEKTSPVSPEMKRLEGVFRLMGSYGVGEVELEDKHGRIHVRMTTSAGPAVSTFHAPAPAPVPMAPAPAAALKEAGGGKPALAANQKHVPSPFVGTFYRASNPSAEPYAKEGQRVKKGQTLCIVEAMKLMNEIECDYDGKIVSVLVENGQPVEFGEPLFIIEV